MSEREVPSPETQTTPGYVIFTPEQLTYLQASVVNEIAPIARARELREKAQQLKHVGEIWNWSSDILSKNFINFFDDGYRIKHEGKILDMSDMDMPFDMTLETYHPVISNRELGRFRLCSVNLESGKIIASSAARKDNPGELEGEIEGYFSFIVDPNLPKQEVDIVYVDQSNDWQKSHNALLPVLAGETS